MILKKPLFIFCFIILLTLLGCNNGDVAEQSNDENNDTENGSIELNSELVEKGEKIAKTSCIGCHGSDLKGDMGPGLHNLQHLTKDEIIDVLIRGKGSMPPATAKDNEEAVAQYLLSLQ